MSLFREVTERYRIEEVLSSGPRATVSAALDGKTGASVVVKRILPPDPADPGAQRRFARFAPALAGLRHTGLPALLDFGLTADGGAFLVFEPVAGRSFTRLAGGAPPEILTLLLQTVDVLELLSRHGLAHANLSPANLLVTDGPAGEQVKVLGLGTALVHRSGGEGTPEAEAAAPEQLAPGAEPGAAGWRADLYALAATACALLGAWATSPEAAEPELNLPLGVSFELEDAEALREVLARCLRPQPEARPAAWDEVREAFRMALCGPAGQPAFGDKTNPVYFPPEPPRAAASAAPALRFEEAYPAPAPLLPPVPPPVSRPEPVPAVPPVAALSPAAIPAVPARAADPAVAEPAPARPAEVLPSLDRFLEAPPPPPAPPAAAEAPTPGSASAPGPAPVPGRRSTPGRRALLAGAAGAVLLLAVLGAFVWLRERPTGAVAPAPPPPAAVRPAPASTLPAPAGNVHLRDARAALDAGDDAAARAALAALTPEETAALTPAEAAERGAIEEALGQTTRQRLAADLRRALEAGNAALLRAALRGIRADEPAILAADPTLRPELERGRRIADLGLKLQRAAKAGDHPQVFALAAALAEAFPRDRTAARAREQSAVAIEEEAERLAQAGQPAAAVERLEALHAAWPDRPGVGERLDRLRAQQETDQRMERVLATVAAAERRGRPDEALGLLRAATPAAAYQERFRETGERLAADLARRDQAPPAVELREGASTEFEKGATPRIALKVTDDFQVARVALFARPEGGGAWRELAPQQSGSTYTAEVPPAFHQNKTVEFYATATDLSGHTGQLGSPDAPRTLKRKKWYQKLRGGREEG